MTRPDMLRRRQRRLELGARPGLFRARLAVAPCCRATTGAGALRIAAMLTLGIAVPLIDARPADGAEGGIGFYLLGQRGSFAAILPPPGTYLQADAYGFSGRQQANIPQGGRLDLDLEADAFLPLVSGIWAPEGVEVGPARPYFGVTFVSGYKRVSLDAELTGPGGDTISGARETSDFLIGDPVVSAGLGGGTGPWFWTGTLAVNVPIGDYELGRPTNIAFNRWAGDLTGAVTWLDEATGREASFAIGYTVNGENDATDYTTGDELHVEAAASQTFASGWTLGLGGYHYQQVTADSGQSALLGDFKGRVTGVGPAVAYTGSLGATPITWRLRYFYEFNEENRIPGSVLFLSASAPLSF